MHDFRRIYRLNILAFAKPRVSGKGADKIIEKLKFDSILESWGSVWIRGVFGYCGIKFKFI